MNNFITNDDDKDLRKRLIELVENSHEMKFLVGFFYFSGIRELFKGLLKNPQAQLKILVGLNVDRSNLRLIEYPETDESLSDEDIRENFLRDIKKSLEFDDFDVKEFYDQVKFFITQIMENRIVIRKTHKPNHAKLYLFYLPDQITRNKLFITGSSNLTKIGITTQAEFNVELCDFGNDEANAYFDELWEDAVKITEVDVLKERLRKTIEKETLVKDVTPYEAYLLTLKTYLDTFEQKKIGQSLIELLEANGYEPFQYQLDAVKQGLAIIEQNNGVIIADVVGLGKTIIACSIARELKKRGVVICPPGLMGDKNKTTGWRMYLEQFKLYGWDVRSVGDLESTAEYVNKTNDIEVVIIDEVHRFRNQDTQDYEFLSNICRDKIVILLTATPFNNRPGDILSLLKLFITPKKSKITLEDNLVAMFKTFKGAFDRLNFIRKNWNSPHKENRENAKNVYVSEFGEDTVDLTKVKQRAKYLADQIRHVIEPVTIRRNRLDLKNNPLYKEEVKNLSEIADPAEWFFELNQEQSDFYDRIIKEYFGEPESGGKFKGAIYRPFGYEHELQRDFTEKENFEFILQRNLFDFMRRLIVKRFESSFGSFRESILRFERVTRDALTFVEKTGKFILDRGLLEKIYSLDEDTIEEYLRDYGEKLLAGNYPKNNGIYEVGKFKRKDEFIADIKADLGLFKTIISELDQLDLVNNDPKGECLIENIKKVQNWKSNPGEPKRKIIIFTEYYDTVKYLSALLHEHFEDRVLSVGGSLPSSTIKRINCDFDAMNKEPTNYYDILLTTDRLSEGFNLNRAGMVINYDIPWNPVRVIQRVGRINRISKKVFDTLYIVNFFPTEKGAVEVKSREIASSKMFLIHEILGEDAKIFDVDETPSPAGLWERITQSPEKFEVESFYTKILKIFTDIKKERPELVESLKDFPTRVKVAKKGQENELIVFLKKGRLYIQGIRYDEDEGKPYTRSFEEILDKIACDVDEPKLELSNDFWKNYTEVKEFKESFFDRVSERSIETRAINNLKTLCKSPWDALVPHLDFVKMMLDDALNYGTLSDYTLRRIAIFETSSAKGKIAIEKEIQKLRNELGDDYLVPLVEKHFQLKKQIIIAIENQIS